MPPSPPGAGAEFFRYPDVYGNVCYLRRARRNMSQVLIGPPPNRWRTIHSDRLDHVKRRISINAQRIKPGEQPFQTEAESRSAFGAMDNFNLGRVPDGGRRRLANALPASRCG